MDKSENVREVEGKVPPQLDGVRVIVKAAPVVVWCLSVTLGNDMPKDCPNCAVTLEDEAHSCLTKFKTGAQCELSAAKYMQDWYADADKNGDEVILAPTAECWKDPHRAEAAIAANAWVLKVPHVKYMTPEFLYIQKGVGETGIVVFVDKSENVREVEGKVPPQLDGVRVVVGAAPVVVWCLSVSEGEEAHTCEKEFKTTAQCESGAVKYVRDWYVDADKNGDEVGPAPTAYCWKITDPIPSHWDPITEKAVPDNQ